MADDASSDGTGHRARLRRRLFEGGPNALHDHELVEYLLGLAIPRRDTKPLAKKLLREFGGFGALLSADAAAIARVGKISDSAAAALKIAQPRIERRGLRLGGNGEQQSEDRHRRLPSRMT